MHTSPYSEMHLAMSSVFHGGSVTDLATYVAGFPLWDMTLRQHAKYADYLVAVSKQLREELCTMYRADEASVDVIPTCVNISEMKRWRTQSTQNQDEMVKLFYAGRLYYRKGVSHLLLSIDHLVNELRVTRFRLNVFGTGPMARSLQKST